jgi:hypothetical protein
MDAERLALTDQDLVELAMKNQHNRNVEWVLHYFGNDWRKIARPETVTILWWLWNRYDVN